MSHGAPEETVLADPAHPQTPLVAISDPGEVGRAEHTRADRFVIHVSNVFAWLFPILMIAICSQVVLRGMGNNQAWLDDAQWWLYGAAVLVGVAYAVTTNSHVRVDIFYDGFAPAKQRRTDIFGLAWLFLPFIIMCWDVTLDYAISSVIAREGSDSPNGLHRLYLLKVFMNLSFLLIAFATWSAYVRMLSRLTWPHWWKRLLFAFPAVWYAVQLAIWYAALGIVLAFADAENARTAGRHPFYDEIELLPGQEAKYTVILALFVTLAIIGVAYLLRDRSRDHDAAETV
ncbi:TRAP transporter small permease subunit [Jannaschia sp. W003]|uniref:TRAP transporter small permease subunit n=1 Tax=Jannaschia sp. W003 TaxID=2867012 RepID=UPI0021A7BAF6|nr:TRAP transporter small permease subunit [Jannaschia sp. W003]UWQ20625.1 TRAP transporter small permease subunit [Jannaschia sp. W003]